MSKIVILKVKEDFNEEQLAALASEEEATLTVTGALEAAQMFDAQMNEDEDIRNV